MNNILITVFFSVMITILVTVRDIFEHKINSLINYLMIILAFGTFYFLPGDLITNYLIFVILTLMVYASNSLFRGYSEGDKELFYWIVPCTFLWSFWSIPVFYAFLGGISLFQSFLMREWKIKELPGSVQIGGAYLISLITNITLWF